MWCIPPFLKAFRNLTRLVGTSLAKVVRRAGCIKANARFGP